MIRVRVDHKPKRGDLLYGYNEWLLAERYVTDGKRGWSTCCIYEAPDDVAAEMIAKGGVIDKKIGVAENQSEENNMDGFKFSLGVTVKDSITGMTGLVIARVDYLHGTAQFLIQKKELNKDGEMADSHWLIESRLDIER